MMSGLAEGIYNNIKKVQMAARAVSGTIDTAIRSDVSGMVQSASITRDEVIVVNGDTIMLDGKVIGKTAAKYISTSQRAASAAKGRRS